MLCWGVSEKSVYVFGKVTVLVKVFVVEIRYWWLKFLYMVFGLVDNEKIVLVRFVYRSYYTLVSPFIMGRQ